MGSKKIEIKNTTDQRQRTVSNKSLMISQIILNRRLKGLIKKAMEISLLTGVEINLTIFNPPADKLL